MHSWITFGKGWLGETSKTAQEWHLVTSVQLSLSWGIPEKELGLDNADLKYRMRASLFFIIQVLKFRSDYCCVIEARRDLAKKNWSPPSEEENQGGKDNQNILPPPFVQYLTSHCPNLLKEFSFQRSRGVWNGQFNLYSKLFGYLAKYEYYSFNSKIQQMTTDHNQQWIQPDGSFHKLGQNLG